jgi:hypothetical protein
VTQYVHHVPGRIRVRTAALKRDPHAAAAARTTFQGLDGVTDVRVNPVTGSLTVTYDHGRIATASLTAILRQRGYLAADVAVVPSAVPAVRPAPRYQMPSNHEEFAVTAAKFVFGMVMEKVAERSALALIGALT